jgi:hypothetical protein
MSPLARATVAVYIALLLLLAALGAGSQLRYREQARLLAEKERAIVDLVTARAAAAAVNGPLAVTTWARAAGMVPAPDAPQVEAVAPGLLPPVVPTPPRPALEVVTVWR